MNRFRNYLFNTTGSAILAVVLILMSVTPKALAGPDTFTSIDFPGAIGTLAYGINSRGDIVGWYFDATGAHG
jgi:hypothetical protein